MFNHEGAKGAKLGRCLLKGCNFGLCFYRKGESLMFDHKVTKGTKHLDGLLLKG